MSPLSPQMGLAEPSMKWGKACSNASSLNSLEAASCQLRVYQQTFSLTERGSKRSSPRVIIQEISMTSRGR